MVEIDEEELTEKLDPILSMPIVFSVISNPKRNDFFYVSTEKKGAPYAFWWKDENDIKQITEDPHQDIITIHPDKPLMIIKKDLGGTENYDLYLLDITVKGSLKQITKNPIGNISDVYWIDDSNLLVIGFDNESYYVKRINLGGQMIDIYKTEEQILNSDYDQERKLLAAAIGRRFTKIAVIDIESSKIKELIKFSKDSLCSFPAFSKKCQLAYMDDSQKTYDEICIQATINSKEIKRFKVPGFVGFWPFDKGAIQWIDEEQLIVFVGKYGRVSLFILDIKKDTWTEIVPEDLSVSNGVVTNDGIVWVGSSLKQPKIVYKFKDNENIKLFEMGKEPINFTIENHWYESYDGRKIQGWLVKNPDPKAPLVIYCHGGPTAANINDWDIFIISLVLAGFNVFAPNFRGSTTFGTEFKDLNIGEFGGGDVKDVLYGAKYIQKILGYEKLPFVFGASHGGFLTLRALTTQPDDWLGGVAWVPMADLVEAYEMANSHYRSFLRHFLKGSPKEQPELYKELSPITYVANLKAPLFIYHGANDSRCPAVSVRRFYDEAKKRNLPIELIVAGDEGHKAIDVEGLIGVLKKSVKHLMSLL